LKLIYLIPIIFTIFFFKIANAQTIVVVNIQSLIDNNESYIDALKEIEISQQAYLDEFKEKESNLKKKFDYIEESKLILSENEINIQIEKYNEQLANFTILVEEFNIHYQNQILSIRDKVFQEIIPLLELYSIENKIDLILDSTNYLIASNAINITQNINNELKKINIKLEHNDFKEN
tara:strand:- start:1565 stop:2098 length:534 start_codon:yes stop_codon:yes gene_type:complete